MFVYENSFCYSKFSSPSLVGLYTDVVAVLSFTGSGDMGFTLALFSLAPEIKICLLLSFFSLRAADFGWLGS